MINYCAGAHAVVRVDETAPDIVAIGIKPDADENGVRLTVFIGKPEASPFLKLSHRPVNAQWCVAVVDQCNSFIGSHTNGVCAKESIEIVTSKVEWRPFLKVASRLARSDRRTHLAKLGQTGGIISRNVSVIFIANQMVNGGHHDDLRLISLYRQQGPAFDFTFCAARSASRSPRMTQDAFPVERLADMVILVWSKQVDAVVTKTVVETEDAK